MPKTKTKTAKATEKKILNVALVWDMSGSMFAVRNSAIEGATDYINKLRKDENVESMRFSIVAFDTVFESWFQDVPVEDLDPNFASRYQPGGWTALNDAIATTIFEMDKRLKGKRAKENVLIVVLTDGQENSSKEFGGVEGTAALAEIVKAREETGRWTFVYLGAGSPESVMATAWAYNIPAGNSVAYVAGDAAVMDHNFAMVSTLTSTLTRSGGGGTQTAMADSGFKSVLDQEDEGDQNTC